MASNSECENSEEDTPLSMQPSADETLDAVFSGELQILQKRRGYRFCVDALLLSDFARRAMAGQTSGKFVDLGAGSGVVALCLAKFTGWHGCAVELQPTLADLARRNAQLNGLNHLVHVIHTDWKSLRGLIPPGTIQQAVSNPPFFPLDGGRVNPEGERAQARHELTGSIFEVASVARWLLADGGALSVVFPAWRLQDVLAAFHEAKLRPRHLQFVHPHIEDAANLVLAEGVKNAPKTKLSIMPPLALLEKDGRESENSARICRAPP